MKLHRLSLLAAFASLLLASCRQAQPVTDAPAPRPVLAVSTVNIPVVYAGESIHLQIHSRMPEFEKAKQADITLEDAVPKILDDAIIESVKSTVPLKTDAASITADFPTTADFKPGIWHAKEITLLIARGKTKVLTEGKDFDGVCVELINAQKAQVNPPQLDITAVTNSKEKP